MQFRRNFQESSTVGYYHCDIMQAFTLHGAIVFFEEDEVQTYRHVYSLISSEGSTQFTGIYVKAKD